MNTKSNSKVQVSIGGQQYLLNLEKAKELGVLEEKPLISIGQRYRENDTRGEYLLATIGNSNIILIKLIGGGFWGFPTEAKDVHNITDEEFKQVSTFGNFELIS